jgi:trans-2,3-dihydro-3-hydroxyanthranilate isomerase
MKYQYYTCDVFTQTRFGGNPLAVLPKAAGLSDHQMQQIAREFNYSETAFVFPPDADHTRRVRLFTPAREVPFAGHPNVGTAFVLATTGELGDIRSLSVVTFEEKAGLVPISIHTSNDKVTSCELCAPQSVSFGQTISAQLIASAVSLTEGDILAKAHRKHVSYLNTLAAAYAETGQFAKAITTQQEAIALSQNEQERNDLASRLKLYESNSPYREHAKPLIQNPPATPKE